MNKQMVAAGANWFDPLYDAAGNMTKGPVPGDESDNGGTGHKYTYDAWNRLVKVEVIDYSSGSESGNYADVVEYVIA